MDADGVGNGKLQPEQAHAPVGVLAQLKGPVGVSEDKHGGGLGHRQLAKVLLRHLPLQNAVVDVPFFAFGAGNGDLLPVQDGGGSVAAAPR